MASETIGEGVISINRAEGRRSRFIAPLILFVMFFFLGAFVYHGSIYGQEEEKQEKRPIKEEGMRSPPKVMHA